LDKCIGRINLLNEKRKQKIISNNKSCNRIFLEYLKSEKT